MCGIVGLTGEQLKVTDLIEALERLEYRGYDSAGVAYLKDSKLNITKSKGKVEVLKNHLGENLDQTIQTGIAHTRWATHGEPNDVNAHPHFDCSCKISVVHNGIIENYRALKIRLQELGHKFLSQTDTEVIPHLIEEYYNGDLLEAVRKAVLKLEGSYAIAVVHVDHPDIIVGARKGSPLVAGMGDSAKAIASDVTPLLKFTKEVIFLQDGELIELSANALRIVGFDGTTHKCQPVTVNWSYEDAQKSGFKHFMLKEIFEEPSCIVSVLTGRIKNDRIVLEELEPFEKVADRFQNDQSGCVWNELSCCTCV